MEEPPLDDCCSICMGDFTIPCRSNCGHWFCANCVIVLWDHTGADQPCKCPLCTRPINHLTTQESMRNLEEVEIIEVLENINRICNGGTQNLIVSGQESPRRVFPDMTYPDRFKLYFYKMRWLALALGSLYKISSSDLIPISLFSIIGLFECCAVALLAILLFIGTYKIRRLSLGRYARSYNHLDWDI